LSERATERSDSLPLEAAPHIRHVHIDARATELLASRLGILQTRTDAGCAHFSAVFYTGISPPCGLLYISRLLTARVDVHVNQFVHQRPAPSQERKQGGQKF
jgi:hypothetical protein